jgi:5'-3' exonuclease
MKYDKLIIDGNNFLYRAFYVPRPPQIVDGVDIATIQQVLYMIKTLKESYGGDDVYITWDKRLNYGGPNFRKDVQTYKEQRVETEETQKIWQICDILQEITPYFGIKTVLPYNLEADDVVGFLAQLEGTGLIISSDKDLFQLINDRINVQHRKLIIDPQNFEQIVGIGQKYYVLYKAIVGDVSDNIKGFERYGPVKANSLAKKLVDEYNVSVDAVLNDTADLTCLSVEHQTILKHNLQMTYLPYAHKFVDEFQSYETQLNEQKQSCFFDAEKVKDVFKKYQCETFLRQFGRWNMLFNQQTPVDQENILDFISM